MKAPRSTGFESRAGFPALRFLVLFLAIVGCYYLLTLIPWVDRHLIYSTLRVTSVAASLLMNLVGAGTVVNGLTIQGLAFAVRVQRGCDPLEPMVLFAAAVTAFPAPARKKLSGILPGAIVLFALNLVRILTLCWTTRKNPGMFETVHQEWWPALFIVAALSLWVVWVRWAKGSRTDASA